MKKNLKQKTRRIWLIIFGLLVICTVGALGWNTWERPQETEKELAGYKYHERASIQYRVFLRPNQLFAEPSLGPGKFYLASLTDRIDTLFEYHFIGQEEADYSGNYTVKGWISASSEDGKDSKSKQEVWRKDFTFVPPTNFAGHNKEVALNQPVSIPYQSYRLFTEQVKEMTKFVPNAVNLNVQYDVSLSCKTSKGPLQENFTSSIVIPLDSAAFTIKGQLEQEKSDSLKTKITVPVPGVKSLQMILLVLAVLFLALLLGVLIFTSDVKELLTEAEKACNTLLKKHGERIIILENRLFISPEEQILKVNSFEDLLKAADELGQPILLEDTGTDDYLFYVRDGLILYKYLLSGAWQQLSKEDENIILPVT